MQAIRGYQYNAAIAACERGRQWQGAVALLSRMRESRVAFTTDGSATYVPAITAASQARNFPLAVALYGQGLACGAVPAPFRMESGELDLHGFAAEVARIVVLAELFLRGGVVHAELMSALEAVDSGDARPWLRSQDLVIITGQGFHSDDGNGKIKPALLQLLLEDLSPQVDVEPVPENPGRLLIRADAISRWAASGEGPFAAKPPSPASTQAASFPASVASSNAAPGPPGPPPDWRGSS